MAEPLIDLNHGYKPLQPEEPDTGVDGDKTILIDSDAAADMGGGAMRIESTDGGAVIDFAPFMAKKSSAGADVFDANLADFIDPSELSRIAAQLIQDIQTDDRGRSEWLETRAKGIEMLGFQIESPRSDTGSSSAPVEGMSTVRHPLLTEAVLRFQSNSSAELLPAWGPVKVRNDQPPSPEGANPVPPNPNTDLLAEALEKDFNHYLYSTDKGYRADTDRMLFWVGFGGCAFKKVYNDPIRQMPISRHVDAADLIVSNQANDIDDAGRVTHVIKMRRSTFVRMQIAEVYRKVPMLSPGFTQPNPVEEKIAEIQGFQPTNTLLRPEDQDLLIYECYVELDIKGFEHKDKSGDVTGLQLPYRVSIEKDSQQVLEIRRNWKEGDESCLSRKVFVKYPFCPALGFYDIGLLQILGNTTKALTGAWRICLDAGMFSTFPGFLYGSVAGRQVTNEFRVPPGGGLQIQTGGRPISDVVMPLPYKEPGAAMQAMIKEVETTGQRIGGTLDQQVAEGKQDAPVGTTLALIEQATKLLSAVHIRLHAAQAEEFQLLKERFREDPEAFWRHNKKPARQWEVDEFLAALEECDIVPAADPNISSHMARVMKAVSILQMAMAAPQLFNQRNVILKAMAMIGIQDADSLLVTPEQQAQAAQQQQQQPPDPAKMAELQLKAQEVQQEHVARMQEQAADQQSDVRDQQLKAHVAVAESADRAADRASRERVAQSRVQLEHMKMLSELAQNGQLHPAIAAHMLMQSMNPQGQGPQAQLKPVPPSQPAQGMNGTASQIYPRVI